MKKKAERSIALAMGGFAAVGSDKPEARASEFILDKIYQLLQRFSFSYSRQGRMIEYLITDRETSTDVSFAVILSNNIFAHQIQVCKFYPGLYRLHDCRYLSAACLFLVIHHFAQRFSLGRDYSIFLQSRQAVYHDFYATLKDFSFRILHPGPGENVDVLSPFVPVSVDTSMILSVPVTDLYP